MTCNTKSWFVGLPRKFGVYWTRIFSRVVILVRPVLPIFLSPTVRAVTDTQSLARPSPKIPMVTNFFKSPPQSQAQRVSLKETCRVQTEYSARIFCNGLCGPFFFSRAKLAAVAVWLSKRVLNSRNVAETTNEVACLRGQLQGASRNSARCLSVYAANFKEHAETLRAACQPAYRTNKDPFARNLNERVRGVRQKCRPSRQEAHGARVGPCVDSGRRLRRTNRGDKSTSSIVQEKLRTTFTPSSFSPFLSLPLPSSPFLSLSLPSSHGGLLKPQASASLRSTGAQYGRGAVVSPR